MDGLFLTSRRHWWERVNNTVIEFHLSVTSGSRRARTRIACLVDTDANDCAIPPPHRHNKYFKSYIDINNHHKHQNTVMVIQLDQDKKNDKVLVQIYV